MPLSASAAARSGASLGCVLSVAWLASVRGRRVRLSGRSRWFLGLWSAAFSAGVFCGVFWSLSYRRRSASSNLKYRHFRRFLAHPVKKGTGRSAALLLAPRARASLRWGPALDPLPGTVPGGEFDWGGTSVKR